jgi:hypothetical protein
MKVVLLGLLLSASACGKAASAPAAAPASAPAAAPAPAPAPAPAAAAPLTAVDDVLDGVAYRVSLPPGLTRTPGKEADTVVWTTPGEDPPLEVTIMVVPPPEDLEHARLMSVLFPKDTVVSREEQVGEGEYVIELHDKPGEGDGASAARWIPHGQRALHCEAEASVRGQDPAVRAELSRICASLAAR